MLAVHAVGRGVLADHQQFLDPGLDQLFSLAQHGMGRAGYQPPAHVGDDAELAFVVTALGYLEIAVVPRGQRNAGGGQKVDERIGRGRNGLVDGIQNGLVLMRPGHGQHRWMRAGDIVGLCPQTARHDDAPILLQGLADRFQTFGLGAVQKTAGVDDHRFGPAVVGRDRIALGSEPGQDAFAVHQRLGAAKRDHADGGLPLAPRVGDERAGEVGAQGGRVLGHCWLIEEAAAGGKGA